MVTCWTRLVTSLIFTLFTCGKDAKTVPDTPCAQMDGKYYNCVKLSECSVLSQLLRETLLSETRAMLKRAHCGFDKLEPKVCCQVKFQCGRSKARQRIGGGTFAEIGEYPWMALLSYKQGDKEVFQCAGTLINEKYVLTAAHCITDDLFSVRIGEHDTSTEEDCTVFLGKPYCSKGIQNFSIDKAKKHEHSSPTNFDNDIGLIRLNKTVDLTRENAEIICLPIYPNLRDLNLAGEKMTTAGWGATENASRSNLLKKVTVSVIDNEECQTNLDYEELYDMTEFLNPQKMCAGEKHKDSCQGDSGGPLMHFANYENRTAVVQFGIVSFGKNAECSDGNWGIYTRVTEYVDWILKNMQP